MAIAEVDAFDRTPGDVVVRLKYGDGRLVGVTGQDCYADERPFADSFDAWAFLVTTGAPVPVFVNALEHSMLSGK